MLISEKYHTARKARHCMAYEWLDNGLYSTEGLTFSEKRSLVLANQAGGMILPGELHRICLKLEMYEI